MGELDHFIMRITCPRCGSSLKTVNEGNPTDGGYSVNAIVRCTNMGCKKELAVHVRLMAMGVYDDDGFAHGTPTAYRKHKRDKETPCQACKDWHAREWVDNKQARKQAREEPVNA